MHRSGCGNYNIQRIHNSNIETQSYIEDSNINMHCQTIHKKKLQSMLKKKSKSKDYISIIEPIIRSIIENFINAYNQIKINKTYIKIFAIYLFLRWIKLI